MREIKEILIEYVEQLQSPSLFLKESVNVSSELKNHVDNNLTLTNNIYRVYSEGYFRLVNEVRDLYENGDIILNEEDRLMVQSDLGRIVVIDGREIYLDAPFEVIEEEDVLEEAKHRGKNVKLNKPFRTSGGPKKFAVYVKSNSGGIKKVSFGDPNLRVRNNNKAASKSFRARHKCDQKKDRTTAGYWSCNVGRYAKQLGLSSSNSW